MAEDVEMRVIPQAHQTSSGAPETAADGQIVAPRSPCSSVTAHEPVTTRLHHRYWPLAIFLIYAIFVVTSWTILCIVSWRPIIGPSSYDEGSRYKNGWDLEQTVKRIKVAQVLQTVAALLTIPVTSAICSAAFVAYMQAGSFRKTLTLRQLMALADQAWLRPQSVDTLSKIGSLPLYVAFGLTLIGTASQILQREFTNLESYHAHNVTHFWSGIVDIPGRIAATGSLSDISYGNAILVAKLRSVLESTNRDDVDANLWGTWSDNSAGRIPYSAFDGTSGTKTNLYFAPLPRGFSSGTYSRSQYAPRLNSSVEYTAITVDQYRSNCRNETDTGGFFAHYTYHDRQIGTVGVEACMTGDLRVSPWKPTRDRQDIIETLYLNFSQGAYFKATANSSLGYFELPRYGNGNKPGPLLAKDPFTQFTKRQVQNSTSSGNATLQTAPNKGPLATLALALFGSNSFVASRISNPTAYLQQPLAYDPKYNAPLSAGNCAALIPLASLTSYLDAACVRDFESFTESAVVEQVQAFLRLFHSPKIIRPGLEAGLFLASKLWLTGGKRVVDFPNGPLWVAYDEGAAVLKPHMSGVGVVVGSVFLGMHLAGLLALALYAWVVKPWKGSLGAEVMVRMGVVHAGVLGPTEGGEQLRGAAEGLPGFVGDETPGEAVGRIGVGAVKGLARTPYRDFEVLR